jgi:hypothetical protein
LKAPPAEAAVGDAIDGDATRLDGAYETILFICRRASQALNDTVKKSEKELKEAQLKEVHSKKQVL